VHSLRTGEAARPSVGNSGGLDREHRRMLLDRFLYLVLFTFDDTEA
jgi:hypothetical protein